MATPLAALRREVEQQPEQDRRQLVRPGVQGIDGEIITFWEAGRMLAKQQVFTMRDAFVRMRLVLQLQRRHRELQAQIRARKRQQLLDTLWLAEQAARTGDSKGLFQCVRWLAPKTVQRSIRLRSESGQLMHPREECRMLADYAAEFFAAKRHIMMFHPLFWSPLTRQCLMLRYGRGHFHNCARGRQSRRMLHQCSSGRTWPRSPRGLCVRLL